MKNNSNIYDIDGELIRGIEDTHKWTLEEAQEKLKKYNEKLKELDSNDPKVITYSNYIKNINRYIWGLYSTMTSDQLQKALNIQTTQKTTDKQVENAINELKKELEDAEDDKTKTQEDLLVDGTDRPETVMDEYVDFKEV